MPTSGLRFDSEDIEDFFENAAAALHWVDSNGIIVRANRHELETLGYERDEYVGHNIAEFHVDPDVIADILARLAHNETLRDYEARLRAKDGSIKHVVINSNVRWSATGEFLHTRCFTRDVTDRKVTERALAEAKADLEGKIGERTAELERANRELQLRREQLMDAQRIASLGNWEWNLGTNQVYWSLELQRIFGFVPGEVKPTHETFVSLIHPDDLPIREEALARGLGTGEPFAYDVRIVRPSGEIRSIHVRARATLDEQGRPVHVVGTAQDVTETRRAEEERRVFEARWQETQRLESLGVLAGGIAHDFNNLLVGMLGNAALALDELPPDSEARRRIEDVELAARRASELIRQMLAYSGQGSFLVQPLDLVGVVQEMGQLLETVVSKKVRLEYEFGPERPVIEADATQLRQVIMNLIVNASEACGDRSGTITVRTGTVTIEGGGNASFALGDDVPAGTYVLLEVSDTGSGMDEETIARIFDPFFTSKFAGRGLGLAAVHGIVRSQGGAIRVESEPGQGTTFSILLPPSDAPLPAKAQGAAGAAERGHGTILLADDETVIRDVAGAMLERAGFTVVAAADGDEAVALFAERSDEIDAVVLDLMMPGRGGDEVLQDLRRIRRDIPVVISSGYTAQALSDPDVLGGVAFVQKPYTTAELVGTVRESLEAQPR